MDDHFLTLSCARCGAKLDVFDDMERFACSHCGTEMIVQRRGGTVSLKGVTEAIKKVQAGTDKTAAELALDRLSKEWQALHAENQAVRLLVNPQKRAWIIILMGIIAIGFFFMIMFTFINPDLDTLTKTFNALMLAVFASLLLAGLLFLWNHISKAADEWEKQRGR